MNLINTINETTAYVHDKEAHADKTIILGTFIFFLVNLVLRLLLLVPTKNVILCATLYCSGQLLVFNLFFKIK